MELNIGTSIRRLRQERNVTQEELADAVGVTAQAVSRWERAEGYPDITLLPEIAGFFSVDLNTVCGLDQKKERAAVWKIIQASREAGSYEDGVRIAREGLKQYPQSYLLKKHLAEQLLGCLGRWTPPKDTLDEVIRLYEDIIDHCTEQYLRSDAMASVCRIYGLAGQHEKAVEAAHRLPEHRQTRDFVLCQIMEGEKLTAKVQHNLMGYMMDMDFMVWKLIASDHYSAEEKITLCRKMIDMFEIVADRGDWNIGLMWPARLYQQMAELYLELNDGSAAFAALENAADCAVRADSLEGGEKRTSLMLNATEVIPNTSTDETERVGRRYCREKIEKTDAFDCIRDTPEYAAILAKLKGGA
ncbi:MAG: helix-turn-helix transcriptional regulator [Clostridia bacterium]|nr:helix-turn-helix transcriptional regulator [Clostridia bacterium]